jgi:hypothetical protein
LASGSDGRFAGPAEPRQGSYFTDGGATVARKVFYSFHYKQDSQRASKVRNMGRLEGDRPISSNRWEEVKRSGDPAIRSWIRQQMRDKTCVVVLIGNGTAGRRWVTYEIRQGWKSGLGVVGIRIHNH